MEDDQLAEIYYERENEYTLAGSVYKGRVTRVLPGMQSAFVDIGLERDAFLYVTDFLEMEDQEDTDEVERAAANGDTHRPQMAAPVAQQGQQAQAAQRAPRNEEQRGEREGRGGRDGRPRRGEPRLAEPRQATPVETEGQTAAQFSVTSAVSSTAQAGAQADEFAIPASVADAAAQQDEAEDQGARRLRGRRRRRGGRGRDEAGQAAGAVAPAGEPTEELIVADEEEEAETPRLEFEAAASAPRAVSSREAAPERHRQRSAEPVQTSAATTPFLLPGESLGKYGSAPIVPTPSRLVLSELPPDTSDPLPERTAAKPSTLIEHEIAWDGKGLMPGESIARHRRAEPEVKVSHDIPVNIPVKAEAEIAAEPVSVAEPVSALADHSGEISEPVVEAAEGFEEVHALPVAEISSGIPSGMHEEEFEEEELEFSDEDAVAEVGAEEEANAAEQFTEAESEHAHEGHDGDISASHNVDPLPPSGFRLKDLFGSRKKEEEVEPPAPVQKTVTAVSAYAPGAGLVEEEVIEDEEYEFTPLKAHHGEEHDLEELEEETLQQQIRSGALGEMLQEAHMDHRILIDSDDEEDAEEEGAPAVGGGRSAAAPGRDRGDRSGGRGRRGGRGPGGAGSSGGSGGDGRRGPSRRSAQTSDLPIISDLLKPGQEILVQIAKEPIAKKGARITSHIALPGRFLVFMPTVSHIGVSRKIASDEERQRLKRILVSEKGDATGGFIVRTAAEGATEEELRADLRFLINLWNDIKQRADTSKSPALIYHDLNLIERILRDQVSDNFSHIWVDSEADYERIVRFLNRFSPDLVRRVKLYTKEIPLFEHFGIQDEISKALRSKVWLKSGGSIVINQTEALVAIDINTGKYVGKTARLEDTILKTNLDSIPEIVRQIRLRDLGGIIVIDFIDMDERKNRTRVMAALEEALKQDRAPTKVLQFNDFGLVAITRKRVKQSLERTLSVPCPVCQATGMVKSAATVANEIYIEVRKMRKHFDQTEVLLRVNPETAKALKANNARWLTELEDLAGKNVLIKSDATLHPEQFDIQG